MSTDYAAITESAVSIALEAGRIIRAAFPRTALRTIGRKGAVNPVTEIDLAVEEFVISRLLATYPEHRILSEEGGVVATGASQRASAPPDETPAWVVDPLDGTNNFAHGFPHVAISIALEVGGTPVVGVIHDPLRGETFAGYQGGGCLLNGEPARVSAVTRLADAFLAAGFPYDRRTAVDNNVERLDHFLRRSQGVRRAGSAALDLAYVACGRFDGFFEIRLCPWDILAGIVLIREAGGRVTDFAGSEHCTSGESILASNGLIHEEMMVVIREGANAPRPDI
jgi:myo-inositol-1(or 4)-monophosphatase